jgi:hypothetical protein
MLLFRSIRAKTMTLLSITAISSNLGNYLKSFEKETNILYERVITVINTWSSPFFDYGLF